jgi:GR25 family glycosyltransferase involved in LPS biosynthesis
MNHPIKEDNELSTLKITQHHILNLIEKYNVSRKEFINNATNDTYINTYVNHIYVINLETNILRRNYIIRLMEKYNINFELIIVPILSNEEYRVINNNNITIGEAGCYLSHMFCLNDAINHNYNKIIIFEDDIILHKKFDSLFKNIVNVQESDILMLGANDFHFSRLNYNFVNKNNVYRPHSNSKFLCGTHAILYSYDGLTELFKIRLKRPTFMDNNLIELLDKFNDTFYTTYPNLAIADLSTTNLNHNFWITDELKEKYYYNNCFGSDFDFKNYNLIHLKIFEVCKFVDLAKTYEENMLIILKNYFKDNKLIIDKVNMRLVYDFFNVGDLKFIVLAK